MCVFLLIFMHIYAYVVVSAASQAPTHPSIRGGSLRPPPKRGRASFRHPSPFLETFMDGCVGAGEAATQQNIHKCA